MARSTCECGESILWKADEPLSDEFLLVALKDLPEELDHEALSQVATHGARCPCCSRLIIPIDDQELGSWAPEKAWLREGRMPRQSDMGVVAWGNYLVAQVTEAFIGNIGPLVTEIATGWVDGVAWIRVAATDADETTDAAIGDAADALDALLGGEVEIRVDRFVGLPGPEWPGYRERRIFSRWTEC